MAREEDPGVREDPAGGEGGPAGSDQGEEEEVWDRKAIKGRGNEDHYAHRIEDISKSQN